MAAYSLDLRQRILTVWQNQEHTQRGLAKRFKVSLLPSHSRNIHLD